MAEHTSYRDKADQRCLREMSLFGSFCGFFTAVWSVRDGILIDGEYNVGFPPFNKCKKKDVECNHL